MILNTNLTRFVQHFNWQHIGEQIATTLFQLLLVTIGLLLVNWIGKKNYSAFIQTL
ncbi:hypothetical protein [Secundilactobacillus silagei]|uniref:hypothetical protein n=1 Tax=Secundilactobacillus silagei TaxID=1293415 RepID=UPI000B0AE3E2|nr:hypothetical protein [Secundilactobacillus silagei]